jgi:ribonuclease Y
MFTEIVVSIVVGGIVGVFVYSFMDISKAKHDKHKAEEILSEAKKSANDIKQEAHKKSDQYLKNTKEEFDSLLENLTKRKDIYAQREENLLKKENVLNSIKGRIRKEEDEARLLEDRIDEIRKLAIEELLKISTLTYEQAKEQITEATDNLINEDYKNRLKGKYDSIIEVSEQFGENIVHAVVQKYSKKNAIRVFFPPLVANKAFLEKYKNDIEELKKITEVEVEFDEDEGTLFIGHYNLVRRTAAYETLKRMIAAKKDQKIDLRKILKEESEKIHKNMEKLGRAVVKELDVNDLPAEIVKLIGRLNYRTSFGQNIMMHALEVSHFATMLAYEVGADPDITKKAALLHDLGKAIDQDVEGSHDVLTKEILEKYNVDPRIVHAAYNHHDAEEMGSVEARLVQAADAISASRPGARTEAGEQYIERIKALEETALATEGVIKAYAIQAGREIRSFVDPDKISDEDMAKLAKILAKNIEDNIQYPGQVMVNMIRELKVTENAK